MLVREAARVPIDGIDPELDRILRKALARDRDARYQTATELAHALEEHAVAHPLELSRSDLATTVQHRHFELAQERLRAVHPRITAAMRAEVSRMTSIGFTN